MDDDDVEKPTGSTMLFILLNVGNFAMLIMGFALIASSLYIYSLAGKTTYVTIFILTIGISEAFLACVAFQLRSSAGGLTCYIFLMVVLLIAKLLASVLLMVIFDKLVQMALPDDVNMQEKVKALIEANMKYMIYSLLLAIAVLLYNIFIGMWYRATMNDSFKARDSKSKFEGYKEKLKPKKPKILID